MTPLQANFTEPLLEWFVTHGRKNLPWQNPRTPYRVWVSETMLQQTQVKTVIPYFNRFIERFPSIDVLASASEDDVLSHWSGLGYYSRARNLRKTANIITQQFHGHFPRHLKELQQLPGIGESTAAAIVSLAFNQPATILDGNVKRVLCRYFLIGGDPNQHVVKKKLWELANKCAPNDRCAEYTQAIMDLGATCCTVRQPNCENCPLKITCQAQLNNEVANYPQKKVIKKLPIRSKQFLLLYDEQEQIYLEKNPPVGLWGGLWCLPAIEIDQESTEYVSAQYNIRVIQMNEIMRFRHSFSHFHLDIKALALSTATNRTHSLDTPGQWFSTNQLKNLGLPKPITTIINHFLEKK
ncbi:MAG: A/G-specific adenine glycosylase [Legionella sp.]